jgi:hypothetical protein
MTYLIALISFLAGAGLAVFAHRNMYSELKYQKRNPLIYPKNSFDRSIVMFYARHEGVNAEEYFQKDHDNLEQSPLEQLEKISKTYQPALLEGGLLKLYDGRTFTLSDVITKAVSVTKHNYTAMDKASYLILELNKLYDELTKCFNREMGIAIVDYSYLPEHMRPVSLVANAKHRYQLLSEKHDGALIQTFRPHTKYPLENELLQTAKFLHVNPDGNPLTTFGGAALWKQNKGYFYNENTPYN